MTQPEPQTTPDHQTQYITHLEAELKNMQERLALLEKTSIRTDRVFQPAYGLITAVAFTAGFILACFSVFKDQQLNHYLTYVAPIAVPFVCFVFDRLERYVQEARLPFLNLGPDALVVSVSLVRAVYELPYISGHAFFLAYALLTVKSWWARFPTLVVLAQVIYLKAFAWHDSTLYGGLLAGCAAALAWWSLVKVLHKTKELS